MHAAPYIGRLFGSHYRFATAHPTVRAAVQSPLRRRKRSAAAGRLQTQPRGCPLCRSAPWAIPPMHRPSLALRRLNSWPTRRCRPPSSLRPPPAPHLHPSGSVTERRPLLFSCHPHLVQVTYCTDQIVSLFLRTCCNHRHAGQFLEGLIELLGVLPENQSCSHSGLQVGQSGSDHNKH